MMDPADQNTKPSSLVNRNSRAVVFLATTAYVLWVFANRLFLVSDGIFWTISARILLFGALLLLMYGVYGIVAWVWGAKAPLAFLQRHLRLQGALSLSIWAALTAAALSMHLRDCAIDYYTVSGKSMEPGLKSGERVLLAKWGSGRCYRFLGLLASTERRRSILMDRPRPRRGDRIVFYLPTEPYGQARILLKRVIALPGQSYEFHKDGRIWIDGRPLQEPYLLPASRTSAQPPLSLLPVGELPGDYGRLSAFARYAAQFGIGSSGTVPPHTLLVLGDHRAHSIDSRNFGFVPYNRIIGVVWQW